MAYGLKACSCHPLTCWEIEINHCYPPPPPHTHTHTHTPMDGYGASRCGFPYSQTNMQRTREGGISLTVRETANYVCRRGVKKLSPCDFLLKIVALSSKSNFFFFFSVFSFSYVDGKHADILLKITASAARLYVWISLQWPVACTSRGRWGSIFGRVLGCTAVMRGEQYDVT